MELTENPACKFCEWRGEGRGGTFPKPDMPLWRLGLRYSGWVVPLRKKVKRPLTEYIVAAGDISPHHHGFRKGHSTIDAFQEVVQQCR